LTGAKAYFQAFESLKATQQASDIETPFKLKDFNLQDYPEIGEWIKHPVKTLVLMGASGVGKTQLAKAFAQDKGLKTLVVNHLEGFKDLESQHDCIIVDDANMRGLDATQLLAVVDSQQNKTLRVLYGTANKKKGLIQMFTMNKQEFLHIKHFLHEERFARRMLFSEIKAPIINMNVNIQVNNVVNHNYAQVSDSERKLIEGNRKRLRECV
jgi:DNA replication protein DnaC